VGQDVWEEGGREEGRGGGEREGVGALMISNHRVHLT
jgi:hypothetical protein